MLEFVRARHYRIVQKYLAFSLSRVGHPVVGGRIGPKLVERPDAIWAAVGWMAA